MRRGGDACVALVLLPRAPAPSCQGDASVPTPRNSAPAPTDTIHPFPQIPTRVSPVLAGISRRAIDEVLADQKYVA